MKKELSAERLRELLHYQPETGLFMWLTSRGGAVKAGALAGTLNTWGYAQIKIDGRLHLAHRLAWIYMTGKWPEKDIDHVNRVKSDNRWVNLREVTASQNMQNRLMYRNNTSGFRGVSWSRQANRWQARIKVSGKLIHLGYCNTPEAASVVYKAAAERMHTHRPTCCNE